MNFSSILVATDLTRHGELAIERAVLLAQRHNSVLHLLHVLSPISWKMFGKPFVEHPLVTEKQLHEATKATLEELANEYRKRYAIKIHCHVEIGRPHERIAHFANAHGIDLTVLGPHADHFGRHIFVGPTVLRLLQQGARSSLVVEVRHDLNTIRF